MQMNQRKLGVILSYVSQGILMISNIIYTPIMLRLLGKNEYGLYQLVFSVVSYLGLLSLGFSSSYIRFYSRYKSTNDENKIAILNGMFMTIFLIISAICGLCGIIMNNNAAIIFGTRLTDNEYATAEVLMVFMVVNLMITFPNSFFDCITTAREKFGFQQILNILQSVINPFITLPLLIGGYGSIGMVVVATILTVAKFVSNIYYCIFVLKIRFYFRDFNFTLLKEMWTFTFFIFINQIVDQVNWSVDKFLLGRYLGTASVAVYGIGSTINIMYIQFSSVVSSVFSPQINQIVTLTNDNKTLSDLFIKVGRIQFIIVSFILSGFIIFGHAFIGFWAGYGYDDSYPIALVLMIPMLIPLIQSIGIEVQRAKNMHKVRSLVYFLTALANVWISIQLIKVYGALGAALGTAMALIAGPIIFMNYYYQRKIGLNIILFGKNIISFVPAFIPSILFGLILKTMISINSLGLMLFFMLCYVVIFFISMWVLGMNDYEKDLIRKPCSLILAQWRGLKYR